MLTLSAIAACGSSPPQIISYSPERGTIDVSTAAPIRIAFDHDVDKESVAIRLSMVPATNGSVRWLGPRQLEYQHSTLQPSTLYEVVLEAGYKDLGGNPYALRHHWSFTTERAPSVTGSTPANLEGDVDPASYVSIDFTRQLDAAALRSAITTQPSVPFTVRLDPPHAETALVVPH